MILLHLLACFFSKFHLAGKLQSMQEQVERVGFEQLCSLSISALWMNNALES
jgi:hypothetical protein